MDDYFDQLTANADDTAGKYLTFWTDNQLFAVPIRDVVQIVGMQEITSIPEAPAYVKGMINLRGSIIPLIDVRLRLGKCEAAHTDRTCIIVANMKALSFGFIVDAVDEVTDIGDELISPPPTFSQDLNGSYLTGVARYGSKIVLLLSTGKLMREEEYTSLVNGF